jgi:hypothetical protein
MDFDAEDLYPYARNNALGFCLLTIAYLRDKGLPVEDWSLWVGRQFAGPETNWVPGMGAEQMAREAALEMASAKAEILEIVGDDRRSVVTTIWPDAESLSELGLTWTDIKDFWRVWEPLAESVGLEVTIDVDASGVTRLVFEQVASPTGETGGVQP